MWSYIFNKGQNVMTGYSMKPYVNFTFALLDITLFGSKCSSNVQNVNFIYSRHRAACDLVQSLASRSIIV